MKTILLGICVWVLCAGAAEWRNISPDGGRILHVAIDPLNPSTVHAATCSGLFKSVDSGASWSATAYAPSPSCDPFSRPAAVTVDPRNSGTLYVTGCAPSKSTDGGATWRALTVSPNAISCFQSIAIDPTNSATLYAAGGRIYKSTDGGDSWTIILDNLDLTGGSVLVDPQNPSILYVTWPGGLFKSVDAGATWAAANKGLSGGVEALAIDPVNSGTLYAGSAGRIFRSEDGGASWQQQDAALPLPPVASARYGAPAPVVALVVNPLMPRTVYALLRDGLYGFDFVSSSDSGTTWTIAHDPAGSVDLTAIAVDSTDPRTLYLGASSGILKTADGGSHWTQSNSGLKAVSVGPIWASSGVVVAANATLSPGSTVFRTADGGRTWSVVVGLPMRITQLEPDPQDPSTIYASSELDILKATNQGATWGYNSPDGYGVPQSFGTGWIASSNDSPLAIDPRNGSTMYRGATQCNPYGTCDTRIYKSLDSGLNWTQAGSPLNGKSCCSYVSQIAVDPQDSSVVYAGTADDNQTGSGLWKSADGGATWTSLGGGDITGLALDPRELNTVYTVWNCCVYKSTDGGLSWNQASADLPHGRTGPVLINPANPKILYCVAYDYDNQRSDVFRSTDGAMTWHPAGSGLSGNVNSIALDRRNPSIVYAGTTTGLYELPPDVPRGPRPVRK